MDPTLPDYVTSARNDAQKMGQVANEYATSSFTIPDELKKVVQEALDYNKDVITNRAQTFSDYQKAPADAGVRFGVDKFSTGEQAGQDNPNFIWNPYERNAATQQYVANKEVPFMMWNKLLGIREGTTADTVNAGTRAFGAQATAASGRADAARTKYSDVLGEYKLEEDLKQRAFENSIKERELALKGSDNTIPKILQDLLSGIGTGSTKPQWVKKNGQWVQEKPKATSLKDVFTPELAGMLMFADQKNAPLYKSVLDLLTPSSSQQKASEKRQTAINEKDYNLSQIDDALKLLEKKGMKTGPLSGALLGAQVKTGIGANQNERDLYSILSKVQAKELFNIGGKVLPAQEMARLEPFLPAMNNPTELNVTNLKGLRKELERSYNTILNQEYGDIGGGMTIQDPNSGDIYEADSLDEYNQLIGQGYMPY